MPAVTAFEPRQLETLHECPYCRAGNPRYLFTERGFSYQECRECALIFLGTRVREDHIGTIYNAEGYHSAQPTSATRRTAEKRVALLGKLAAGARVFEDGAGDGLFVAACRNAGYSASGCDLGADAVTKAREAHQVDLRQASLEEVGLESGAWDALACFNLLSHLYRPWQYMREVARVLRPSGIWLTRVGDKTGWKKQLARGQWSAPEHVFHFPLALIERMANDAGLELAESRPAFDSDFPYVISQLGRGRSGRVGYLARHAARASLMTWVALRLPRDDYYLSFRKA